MPSLLLHYALFHAVMPFSLSFLSLMLSFHAADYFLSSLLLMPMPLMLSLRLMPYDTLMFFFRHAC